MFRRTLLVALLSIPAFVSAQRLPEGVVPASYNLTFTPDLQKATFAGEETIAVQVQKATSAVTMNAIELQIQSAQISQGENSQQAQVVFAPENEQVTLTVPQELEPGPANIVIKFTGTLNSKLRGFYLAHASNRNYAVTQFESTDARRAFPSFDEPALKATFDLTLIVDKNDTAISNGKIISDAPGPGPDQHSLKFSTTPKMSTYLVAMAVGDFVCQEGSADDVPIRVCGTPDKKPLATAALRYAEEILKFYNQYYGIKYPFGKLDIVGAPDFEAGAMENTAAIFYRESDLFIDDQHASADSRQAVFEVLAHEMSHQWFGDLVTMKWWDNLWLNEGFATWMARKPSQAIHPEWNSSDDAVTETDGALITDSRRNTHAIHARAETPDEINELFDSISYNKGAAVLRMIENYVSPDVFRRGVNSYLRKFSYSNATAEDFWQAITLASGRPVDKIMPGFINQPGAPLVTLDVQCVTPQAPKPARKSRRSRRQPKAEPKTEITLTQQRYFTDAAGTADTSKLWTIPVCLRGSDAKPFCQTFSGPKLVLPVAGCSSWVFANASAAGYYRTQYQPEILQKLALVAASQLTTAERMSLLNDQAALTRSGQQSVAGYLDLLSAFNHDAEDRIVSAYSPTLFLISDYIVADHDRPALQAWIRSTYRPLLDQLGWPANPADSDGKEDLRASLLDILANIGQDQDVIRRASELSEQFLKDPDSVNSTLASTALSVAASHGNAELFDRFLAARRKTKSPNEFYTLTGAVQAFRDPAIVQRWLQIAVSPETRNQDAPFLIAGELSSPDEKVRNAAWSWVKEHWQEVSDKTTMSTGASVISATGSFCDAQSRDDAQSFFESHQLPSSDRALKISLEKINSCIAMRSHQQGSLSSWLQQHGGSATPAGR